MTRVDVVSPPPLISFVTDRIATGRGPVSGIELGLLVRAGVTHIIDCRDDPRLSLNVAPGRRLWIPALDDCAPKPAEWFDEAVTFARSALADPDARLFVHCELGINRGPSVAYAILRAVEGLSAEGAASAITAARPVAAMAYVADVEHYLAALDQQPGCPLCDAAPITRRYAETDLAWVADCAVCGVPMVVWRHHGTEPTDAEHLDMLDMLDEVAIDRFGDQRWLVDQERRSIPQHWHAHARPLDFTDRKSVV